MHHFVLVMPSRSPSLSLLLVSDSDSPPSIHSDGCSTPSVQGLLYSPLSGLSWTNSTTMQLRPSRGNRPQPDQDGGSHSGDHAAAANSKAKGLQIRKEKTASAGGWKGITSAENALLFGICFEHNFCLALCC